jgi:Fuc2NAc and GlcNAc transferase
VTLIRRITRGDRWFNAHRTHAYQHLARRWKGHLPVTMLVMAINVFWLLPLAIFATRYPAQALWLVAIALAPLVTLAIVSGAGTGDN